MDLRAAIESFRPKDGEELGMYYRRGTAVLRDSKLALLPHDTQNHLLRKSLEGLNSDQHFVSFISDYLHLLKQHEKSIDQSHPFRFTMEHIYDAITNRSCPTMISLTSVEDQVRLHFVNFATRANDDQAYPPTIAAQARYGRPPNKSERHPSNRNNQHGQECLNNLPCQACGL